MLSEREALQKLLEGEVRLPPLQIELVSAESPSAVRRRFDWVVRLSWEDCTLEFGVEYTSRATPKGLRQAINQVREAGAAPNAPVEPEDWRRILEGGRNVPAAPSAPDPLQPLVMAPYLDAGDLDVLLDNRISGIDFCGNGVIVVPKTWLIYRTGAPNRYPSSAPIKAIYRGTSSLVGRVLLAQPSFDQVQAVETAIEERGGSIALSTVSRVLKGLEEDLVISREDDIELIQPDLLLDKLTENYEPPRDLRTARGRLASETTLREIAARAEGLGLRLAVSGVGRYAEMPTSDRQPPIYVDRIGSLAAAIGFSQETRFANVELRETTDQRIYFDTRVADGVQWTSPLQAYLEMATGDRRARELSQELRSQIIQDLTDARR